MVEKQEKNIQEKNIAEIIDKLMEKAMKYIMSMDKDKRELYIDSIIFNKMRLLGGEIHLNEIQDILKLGWNINDLNVNYVEDYSFYQSVKVVFTTPTGRQVVLLLKYPKVYDLNKRQYEEYMFYKSLCSNQ